MRSEKQSLVKEIRGLMEQSDYVLVAGYRGMTVAALSDLRRRLAQERTRLQIVKNTYLRVAADQCGRGPLMTFVEGPVAMVTGGGDISRVAKVLKGYSRENEALKVRGGVLGKTPLSPEQVKQLADLPSREALYGSLVGTLAAPMQQLVGVMSQKLLSLIYVLQAVEDKKKSVQGN